MKGILNSIAKKVIGQDLNVIVPLDQFYNRSILESECKEILGKYDLPDAEEGFSFFDMILCYSYVCDYPEKQDLANDIGIALNLAGFLEIGGLKKQ